MRALARRHGPLAVVHLDAHFDISGPDAWGDAYHHGTPLKHAIDELTRINRRRARAA